MLIFLRPHSYNFDSQSQMRLSMEKVITKACVHLPKKNSQYSILTRIPKNHVVQWKFPLFYQKRIYPSSFTSFVHRYFFISCCKKHNNYNVYMTLTFVLFCLEKQYLFDRYRGFPFYCLHSPYMYIRILCALLVQNLVLVPYQI